MAVRHQCAVSAGPGRGYKPKRIVRQVVSEIPETIKEETNGGDDDDEVDEDDILSESDSESEEAVKVGACQRLLALLHA